MADESVPDHTSAGLIDRLRAGDDTALGELFEAHEPAVRRLARGLVRDAAEADDVTAETFFRTLQAVRRGNGPRDNVRAYLMTVARRVSWEWQGSRRDVPVTDDELTSRAGAGSDWQTSTTEASLITSAFSTLPERWRTVLWQTEVEGEQPAVLARHFGLSANATAALARRARMGLRAAYLQAHLTTERGSNGCRSVRAKLGGYTAGSVTGAESRKIAHHLAVCSPCRATHDELRQVCSALRTHAGAVLPLVPLAGLAAGAAGALSGAGSGTGAGISVATAGGTAAGGASTGGVAAGGAAAGGAAAGGVEAGAAMALVAGTNSKLGLALASTAAAVTVVSAPVLDGIAGSGGADDGTPSRDDYALTRSDEDPDGGGASDFVGSPWAASAFDRPTLERMTGGAGTRSAEDSSAAGKESTPAADARPGPTEYTLPPSTSTGPPVGVPDDEPAGDPESDSPGPPGGIPDDTGAADPGPPPGVPTGGGRADDDRDPGVGRGDTGNGTGPGDSNGNSAGRGVPGPPHDREDDLPGRGGPPGQERVATPESKSPPVG